MGNNRKIIIAVTGASGSVYAETLLERITSIKNGPGETALVFTDNARDIWKYELGGERDATNDKRNSIRVYDNNDFLAPFASGSSRYDTMIICPASMGVTGRIANGIADDLVTRAADVMLKERRKLILVPRETPYNLIHINNMKLLTEAGAIILPASPSFYSLPRTIKELAATVTDRVLDLAGFDIESTRWGGE